jgi:tetratricopeptide (TPR) repeat protein
MTEEKLKNLLQKADQTAGPPDSVRIDISTLRRRAHHRHIKYSLAPLAAAAVLLIAVAIWKLPAKTPETTPGQNKIASLESQIKRLQASTDAAIDLIHQVLEQEKRKSQLNELQAQLASISDPLEEIQQQVNKTAFILVYQADRLYRELNQTESAVETYKRVIQLFPENQWAQVARERLAEIKEKQSYKIDLKGKIKWNQQNV